VSKVRWPWVSRLAYDLALKMVADLQARNDRLVEALSRHGDGHAEVMMPRQPVVVEPASGWWDRKPTTKPS
jgi:hypothetical protein